MLEPAAVPSDSMCFWHPGKPAVQACERCGTFGCTRCLQYVGDSSRSRLCLQCLERATAQLPSLDLRAKLAVIGLAACSVADVLNLITALSGVGESADAIVALGYLVSFLATVVLFCRWFHLAVRHVRARGLAMSVTPARAVVTWFVPFRNLVTPFAIAREMLAATQGKVALVSPWQATWIIGNIVSNLSTRFPDPGWAVASTVFTLVSAFTCYLVVANLTEAAVRPMRSESVA